MESWDRMQLNHVTLPVRDIERSRAFYERLGLTLIVHTPHYCRFDVPGGTTFSIHATEGEIGTGAVIYFESDRLDELVADLTARGIVFESGPEDRRWLWREARLRDPDGHALCFYWAGANRRFPPWRIDGKPEAGSP